MIFRKKIKVFSIVLNYQRPKETIKAVYSLIKQKGNFIHQIIIVDNSLANEFVKLFKKNKLVNLLSKKQTVIKLIKNKKNLGFAGGNNIAIKYALKNNADYVFLLNDDAYLNKNCLLKLISFMEKNKNIGIVSPKIYFAPGFEFHKKRYQKKDLGKVIWYAGGKIDWQNVYCSHRGVDEVDKGQYNKQEETDFATGCAMLIKNKVFKKIGLFDEKYLMYWEDVDFCQRAKKAGFKVFLNTQAKAWHKNLGTQKNTSNEQKDKYMASSRLRFGLKHASLKIKLFLLKEYFLISFF